MNSVSASPMRTRVLGLSLRTNRANSSESSVFAAAMNTIRVSSRLNSSVMVLIAALCPTGVCVSENTGILSSP